MISHISLRVSNSGRVVTGGKCSAKQDSGCGRARLRPGLVFESSKRDGFVTESVPERAEGGPGASRQEEEAFPAVLFLVFFFRDTRDPVRSGHV